MSRCCHENALATVVTTRQLLADGFDPRLASRRVRAGHWQRPARGVYVTHSEPLLPLEIAEVGLAYTGPEGCLTGALALQLLGLRWVPPATRAHVLVPDAVRQASSGLVTVSRWTYALRGQDWTGLTLAPTARAVADAARGLQHLAAVRGVVLGAVADQRVSLLELREALAGGQRNGSGSLRRAVLDAARGCASPPEAEIVDALAGRGVPFLVNPEVWCDGQLLGRVDVLPLDRALGGEVESDAHHGSAADRLATYDRHERFAAAGIDLVHLSVLRLRRDVAEAAAHLLSRAAAAGPMPANVTVVPRGPILR